MLICILITLKYLNMNINIIWSRLYEVKGRSDLYEKYERKVLVHIRIRDRGAS